MRKNITFISAGLLVSFCLYVLVELIVPFAPVSKKIEIKIPRGASFRQVIEIFSKEKLMRDKNLFLLIGKMSGLERKIRAGYYSVYGAISPLDILTMLRRGQIMEYEVTIVEGDSLREIAEKLSGKNIIKREDFFELSSDGDFLALYDIDAPTFEGYIFPDTYRIPKGADPVEAIGMMIDRMREKFTYELRQRALELGFSENEVVTLASIIEKEAATDSERPLISATYHNRLRKGMPLQADPTCVYGIKGSGEKITVKDLRRKTPYNTYINKGLPPGPIASPGLKSIVAAVYPAEVPYVYFVSNGDGTHKFSVTSEEHITAVKAYREKQQLNNNNKEKTTKGK